MTVGQLADAKTSVRAGRSAFGTTSSFHNAA